MEPPTLYRISVRAVIVADVPLTDEQLAKYHAADQTAWVAFWARVYRSRQCRMVIVDKIYMPATSPEGAKETRLRSRDDIETVWFFAALSVVLLMVSIALAVEVLDAPAVPEMPEVMGDASDAYWSGYEHALQDAKEDAKEEGGATE